jgi:hypothetical protein
MVQRQESVKLPDVFVLNVLEEFEFAVGTFGKDGGAKGFHDLLYGDGCTC